MLIVLPTHSGDRDLAVALCEHIARLGGVQNHEALIVAPTGTNLAGIENTLRGVFGNVFVHTYPETMKGWPYGPNEAAMEAMMHVFLNPALRYHYLMLEPDCVPTTKFWADMLDMDYRRSGQHVMGVRIPTTEIATGRVVGTHTVGVAVYPKNFPQLCPLVKGLGNMTRAYHQQQGMPMPWDAYFGPYTAKMTAETTLIQHLSRVRQQTPAGWRWDCPSLENALQQTNKQAVLVHGSKHPEFLRSIMPYEKTANYVQATPAPATEVVHVQSGPANGQESGQPHPPSGDGQKVVLTDKQVKKKRAQAEAVRKEFEIEAELGTPAFSRAVFFHTKMKWPDLKKYASKIGATIFRQTRNQLINGLIRAEIAQGIEQWVKDMQKAAEPPPPASPLAPVALEDAPPVSGFGLSTSSKVAFAQGMKVEHGMVDEKTNRLIEPAVPIPGGSLSPDRQEQMRKMLAERQLLPAG